MVQLETVTLKCLCGNVRVHSFPEVDIAEMLRCAFGDGWRRINREPVDIKVAARGWPDPAIEIEVELYGQCGNCAGREEHFLDSILAQPAHSKTLHEIIAARRGR